MQGTHTCNGRPHKPTQDTCIVTGGGTKGGTFACGANTRAFSRAKYDGVQLMPIERAAEGDRLAGAFAASSVLRSYPLYVPSAQVTLPSPHPVTILLQGR